MANVYQQAANRRKLIYLSTIGVLLLSTLVVRGTIKVPIPGVKEVAYEHSIEGRARRHELTELSQGDAELGGSAVQLLLTGSRGLAVCVLWNHAIEKQKKQEWSEMDIAVKSITKLQPHFTAPWLFQSWNITYNVSVEMDRLNDMYFYIARGISIIAEGEALNRNNPDLRYNIGFYYQNKFGVSDKVTTLRCLYQLSCIPEEDRDAERLLNPDRTINTEKFEAFCKANPQLIRRLKTIRVSPDGSEQRARPLVSRPEGIIAFLRTNKKLPSRYKPGTKELNDRLRQFPVLPELQDQPVVTKELDYRTEFGDHESDAFLVSRSWYALANVAIPPPNPIPTGENTNPDPFKYRIPKRPTLIVFRQGPVRAQTYHAERLTKEAWFDRDPYELDDVNQDSEPWIRKLDPDGKPVSVKLTTPTVAQDAWKDSSARWREHGRANGLYLEPTNVSMYTALANQYCQRHPDRGVGMLPDAMTAEEASNEEYRKQHEAMMAINGYYTSRQVTQYETFDIESQAMSSDDGMLALKLFHRAEKADREEQRLDKAAALYEQAFAAWKRVLNKQDCRASGANNANSGYTQCRDFRDLERYQEDMYEKSMKYMQVSEVLNRSERRAATLWVHDLLSQANTVTTRNPFLAAGNLNVLFDRTDSLKRVTPIALPGPLDGDADSDGKPWVSDMVKLRVKEKLGLIKRQEAPPAPPVEAPK